MKKQKKPFTITADLFNNPLLTHLIDFLSFISPAKSKNEKAIRQEGRRRIANGDYGPPVNSASANLGGKLDRDRILKGTSIFGSTPPVTEDDVKFIRDAGFDFIINGNSGDYAKQISDWCYKHGLAVIGSDCIDYVQKNSIDTEKCTSEELGSIEFHPASIGDSWYDEPDEGKFRGLAEFQKKYSRAFPDRFLFINLLPGGAVKSALGSKNYVEYVNNYSNTVNDDYISLDIYPFHPSMLLNRFEMMITLHTYGTIGNACRRDGKDFWLYIQTQMRWFSHLYTFTTYEMIKWQCYASMCFGCRSIIHASYNPVWGDEAIGIIDREGKLTEQYLYVRSINAEMEKLSPVLSRYRSLGVEFSHSEKINPHFIYAIPKLKKDNKDFGFSRIPQLVSVKSNSTALAGYFENADKQKGIMLVDCGNILDPYFSQSVSLKFDKKYSLSVYEHGELSFSKQTDEITVNLNSCDGVFITLDTEGK